MMAKIAGYLWSIAILAGFSGQSLACGPAEYRQAATLLADSSLRVDSSPEAAEEVLRACGDDPIAAYLMGMFPRFAEFSPEKTEEFRRSLSRAAEDEVPAAALIHGAWLFDTNTDREHGAQLMTKAYAAEDEWGLGIGYGILSGRGKVLSDADLGRVERLSEQGYPWAYGILASQQMLRISDVENSLTPKARATALINAHNIALQGMLRGDSVAVREMNLIGKELYRESKGLANLADVLSAPEPLAFASSHPKEMESAYLAWQTTPLFEKVDGETLRLMKISATVCSGSIPSKWKQLCEVRAVADHYVCMQPFGSYMADGAWVNSSAYRTCRTLRLRVQSSAPYY
jgi:hypothetical protein